MGRLRAFVAAVLLLAATGGVRLPADVVVPAAVFAQQTAPAPPAPQDEFVPVSELPPQDQLPAAPLLVIAYAFAWVMVLGYVWMLWRRLGRVERELTAVSRQSEGARRS